MKQLLTALLFIASVMLCSSCQKELPDLIKNIDVNQGGQSPTPTPTPAAELKVSEPGQFGAKGGEQTITVTASAAWTISKSSGSDWITVKPESGNSGTSQVTLTANENSSIELRTATLFVRSGELTKSIDVSQSAANPELSLDTSSLEFASGNGAKSFKITANISWMVSSDQTWCSVGPTSGSNNETITVKVSANTTTYSRTAMVTVNAGSISKTVSITQSGADNRPGEEDNQTPYTPV